MELLIFSFSFKASSHLPDGLFGLSRPLKSQMSHRRPIIFSFFPSPRGASFILTAKQFQPKKWIFTLTFLSTSVIFVGSEGGLGSVFSLNGASLIENPALPFALTAETRNTYQWPNSISLIVTSWRSTTSATWRHSWVRRKGK